jgi:mannose-1-phosphate guanylyltransferase
MQRAAQAGDQDALRREFESMESVSIDYALMERATNVVVVRGEFPWDDVGAWPALERTRRQDNHGNVVHGNPVLVDCQDCIVYNEPGATAMAVGVIGLRDVVVVISDDAVLVMPKDRAQEVREVVKVLRQRKSTQI